MAFSFGLPVKAKTQQSRAASSQDSDPAFALKGASIGSPTKIWGTAASPTQIVFGIPAVNFRLVGTDGRTYGLDDVAGKKGTVVVLTGWSPMCARS
jgi:hypothetical protein